MKHLQTLEGNSRFQSKTEKMIAIENSVNNSNRTGKLKLTSIGFLLAYDFKDCIAESFESLAKVMNVSYIRQSS